MIDTTYHRRKVAAEMADEEFRSEYNRAREELSQINAVMEALDKLRIDRGFSKAALARESGRNGSAVRRLFSAEANPELSTVAALASVLGAEIRIVRKTNRRSNSSRAALSA